MQEFPDLGFPYAVFHDFDSPAPGWVISKRWLRTDDANFGEANQYLPSYERNLMTRKFAEIVENPPELLVTQPLPVQNTVFDIARVR
jgi:hypothetical protein